MRRVFLCVGRNSKDLNRKDHEDFAKLAKQDLLLECVSDSLLLGALCGLPSRSLRLKALQSVRKSCESGILQAYCRLKIGRSILIRDAPYFVTE
jgi:hypothetical protein